MNIGDSIQFDSHSSCPFVRSVCVVAQELKKSIATLQEKVIASSRKHDNSN